MLSGEKAADTGQGSQEIYAFVAPRPDIPKKSYQDFIPHASCFKRLSRNRIAQRIKLETAKEYDLIFSFSAADAFLLRRSSYALPHEPPTSYDIICCMQFFLTSYRFLHLVCICGRVPKSEGGSLLAVCRSIPPLAVLISLQLHGAAEIWSVLCECRCLTVDRLASSTNSNAASKKKS